MALDPAVQREQSRESWNEMAQGWEARCQWMSQVAAPVSEWILAAADPQPGQTVLEVAGGPGDLGRRAGARVGDDGRVVSTDFAAEMVAAARRLGAGGPANVEYRALDAEAMDLEDDFADAVLCRWGYMLMADPAAALIETRRVLRAGGPLAFSVWTRPDRNPWVASPGRVLVERGHLEPPDPDSPGMFTLAEPARIEGLLGAAGFAETTVEEIPFAMRYADADEFWGTQVQMSARLAGAVRDLPEAERAATRAAVEESLAEFRGPDGSYEVPAVSLGVLAR